MAAKKSGTAQSRGKWFEGKVQEALAVIQQKYKAHFQRLYDTASAGSLLPKQPGDFVLNYRGITFLVEVKSSNKYKSLADPGAMRSLIEAHQCAGQRIYRRALGGGMFIFLSADGQTVEIWDGDRVAQTYITPRARLKGRPNGVTDLKRLNGALKDYLDTVWPDLANRVIGELEGAGH